MSEEICWDERILTIICLLNHLLSSSQTLFPSTLHAQKKKKTRTNKSSNTCAVFNYWNDVFVFFAWICCAIRPGLCCVFMNGCYYYVIFFHHFICQIEISFLSQLEGNCFWDEAFTCHNIMILLFSLFCPSQIAWI